MRTIVYVFAMCFMWEVVASEGQCIDDARRELNALVLSETVNRSTWGVLAYTVGASGLEQLIFSHNDERVYAPASNTKLLTTAAFFRANEKAVKTGATFSSPVYTDGTASICMQGMGDPTLTRATLDDFAKKVYASGITHVQRVVVRDGFFSPSSSLPGNWDWGDLVYDYGAQPSNLMVDTNQVVITLTAGGEADPVTYSFANPADHLTTTVVLDVTVRTGAEPDVAATFDVGTSRLRLSGTLPPNGKATVTTVTQFPAQRFADTFADALAAAGVRLGVPRGEITFAPCTGALFGHVVGQAASDALRHTLKASDNTWAEVFLRHMGANATAFTGEDTIAAGLSAIRDVLVGQMGVPAAAFSQADGSGLSRSNLISPESLVHLLLNMDTSSLYKSYLPISGVDGTLAGRLDDPLMKGRVHAKTGTLTGTNALSGYINRTGWAAKGYDESEIIFSIITSGAMSSSTVMRKYIDDAVRIIAKTKACNE